VVELPQGLRSLVRDFVQFLVARTVSSKEDRSQPVPQVDGGGVLCIPVRRQSTIYANVH